MLGVLTVLLIAIQMFVGITSQVVLVRPKLMDKGEGMARKVGLVTPLILGYCARVTTSKTSWRRTTPPSRTASR